MRGNPLPHFQKPSASRSSSRPRCELAVNQKGFYFVSSIEIHVEIGETMDIYLFCVPCVSRVCPGSPPSVLPGSQVYTYTTDNHTEAYRMT